MTFALIRLMPVFLAAAYLALAAVVVWAYQWWWLWLVAIIGLVVAWCALLVWHSRAWRSILIGAYMIVYILSGLVFSLLVDHQVLLLIFILAWSLFLFLLVEASFHYLYQTDRVSVVNLKYMVYYLNIVVVFVLGAVAANLVLFLGLDWVWAVLIIFIGTLIIGLTQLLVYERLSWQFVYFALIGALIMAEINGALLWWPVSFYVMAAVGAIVYYWLTSIISARWDGRYKTKALIQYSVVALISLAAVLVTAKWL